MEKRNGGNNSVTGVLSVMAVSAAVTLLGCLLSAWLLHREYVEMESLGYLATAVLMLSGITCGFGMKKTEDKLLLRGMAAEAGVFLLLLASGALFFDGKTEGVLQTLLLMTGTMLAAILVGTNRKQKPKSRRHIRRNG